MHTDWDLYSNFPRPERRSLSDYVADQVRSLIETGRLKPTDQLPPLRVLARHYGISVPTLRVALTALAYAGYLEVHHGLGCFVSHRRRRTGVQLSISLERARRQQLNAIRRMVEPEAAQSAARHGETPLASELHFWAHERDRRAHGPVQGFLDADAAFHRVLVAAAEQPLMSRLHGRAVALVAEQGEPRATDLASDRELAEWHLRLARAVLGGDRRTAMEMAGLIVAVETDADAAHPARAGPTPSLR